MSPEQQPQISVEWIQSNLEQAREGGLRHAMFALGNEAALPMAADAALAVGWHLLTVWPSGNHTMALFRWVAA